MTDAGKPFAGFFRGHRRMPSYGETADLLEVRAKSVVAFRAQGLLAAGLLEKDGRGASGPDGGPSPSPRPGRGRRVSLSVGPELPPVRGRETPGNAPAALSKPAVSVVVS